MNGAATSFRSKLMKIIALSVMEAEMFLAVMCAQDILFMRRVINSMVLKVKLLMNLYIDTGSRRHCTLKSHLILVNCYFVLDQFQIKRDYFSLLCPTYVHFGTKILVLYFLRTFSAANFLRSPRKFGPHSQQQYVHHFTSHQKSIDLNNQRNLQYLPNKVSIFE